MPDRKPGLKECLPVKCSENQYVLLISHTFENCVCHWTCVSTRFVLKGQRSHAKRNVQTQVKSAVYHQAVGSVVLTPTYHAINMWQRADPFPYHIKHKDQGHQQVSHSKHIDQSAEGESNGRPSHRRETQCQVEQQVLQEFWL